MSALSEKMKIKAFTGHASDLLPSMLATIERGKKKHPLSPALSGQPETITGNADPAGLGHMPTTSSALAPAPSPGGTAQVGGAPLSSNEAQVRQGGAGADLDLAKDRGTPMEYWGGNMKTAGSKATLQMMGDSLSGASGATGEFATMDQEEVRRAGNRMNEAMGIGDEKSQDRVIEEGIVQPIANTIRAEIGNGTIDADEGVARMAQVVANTKGASSEEDIENIVSDAAKRVTDAKPKERKNIIKRVGARMKKWWNKGKGNPNVEVTGFMGGMNRQELGMFMFQWGALMMANAEKGFGGAMGMAGLGALQGHQERRATESALAGEAQDRAIKQQQADAATLQAEAAMERAKAYSTSAGRGFQGKDPFLIDYYRSQNMSEEEILDRISGAQSPKEVFDTVAEDVGKMVASAKEDPPMIPSQFVMVDLDGDGVGDKAMHLLSPTDEAKLAKLITEERLKARQQIGAEMTATPSKSASEYLNEAQND